MNTKKYSDYQKQSRKTWGVIKTDHPIIYPTLGLANETGEFVGKIKKIFRDKKGKFTADDREALKQELGDVLWYFTQICTELDLKIEEVAEANLDKVLSRMKRDKLNGEGDNR
jgi:NTP pyrophosphatase (non-canonical NTP hydrolase)